MKALILAGGKSSRMGQDKASLKIGDTSLLDRAAAAVAEVTDDIYLSISHDDTRGHSFSTIRDLEPSPGPLGALQAAFAHDPDSSWLLLACDLPRIDATALKNLTAKQDSDVTCFLNPLDDHPEPLCAVYAPSASVKLTAAIEKNQRCARKFLRSLKRTELTPEDPQALLNLNRPEHLTELELLFQQGPVQKTVTVEYFAKLAAEAKVTQEKITTTAATLIGLWEEVRLRHHFSLDLPHIKPAVANEFANWTTPLTDHDTIAFMPPFAGG